MPYMTYETIAADPWNAVVQDLPPNANLNLLDVAFAAAEYCGISQYALMMEARGGRYIPLPWTPEAINPDAHEIPERKWLQALDRYEVIKRQQAVKERECERSWCWVIEQSAVKLCRMWKSLVMTVYELKEIIWDWF